MTRINRKVEYALMALKHMSSKYAGQLTTVKEVCASTQIPFDATSRVMQQMAQRGYLKAEHGAHGGYLLVCDLNKISFHDIVEAVLGKTDVVRCAKGQVDCDLFAKCNIASPLQVFNDRLSEFYKSLPVSQIIGKPEIRAIQKLQIVIC